MGLGVEQLAVESRLLPTEDLLFVALVAPAWAQQRINPAEQIIILIDALDENRYHPTTENILALLTNCPELPENIRFVLASRPPDEALKKFCSKQASRLSQLTIAEEDAYVKEDIEQFAKHLFSAEALALVLRETEGGVHAFAEKAAAKAHGNLAYLDALARGINQALARKDSQTLSTLLSLKALPAELEGFYAFFLHQLKAAVARERIELKDPNLPKVKADSMLMKVVFINLLRNSIDANARKITISGKESAKMGQAVVWDTPIATAVNPARPLLCIRRSPRT